jgi:hypothetical protein
VTAVQHVNWFQRDPGGGTVNVVPVLRYRTSSRCGSGGCVAVAPLADGGAVVRSTLDPDRVLQLTPTQRSELLKLAKHAT